MENCNTVTTTLLETSESQNPVPVGSEESQIENSNHPFAHQHRHKGLPWLLLVVVFMAAMLIMNAVEIRQYKQYSETLEQQAYVLSVSINLLEDTLLFNYKILPEDIGFEELRSTWISNPCYETAMPYYEALRQAVDHFENNYESTPNLEPILL